MMDENRELPESFGHDKHSELPAMITEDLAEGRLGPPGVSGLQPATAALKLSREARERCEDCRDFVLDDQPPPPRIEPPGFDLGL